ncbi:hypothetical protein INT47_002280 [Mucor saturninus]|uniref:Tetraspanin n=1 Tax=Mucor saturninus TaxID=64648 RepID=A0A8H7QX70_9FUNG|nr:hypothetical protein INT47_002280 [Mucor saturninus]
MDDRIMYKRSQALREYVASFHLTLMVIIIIKKSIMITTTSFIGCFGAHLEHTGFLNTYSSITAIALILELVAMGLAYTHTSQLDYYGSLAWDFFKDNDSQFLVDLEQSVKCCGYGSVSDRAVPKTCSVTLGVDIGCRESIMNNVQAQHQWITIIILVLLSVQFVALLVSVVLSCIMDRETREEETYMALLSQNNNWSNNGGESSLGYIGNSGYFGRNTRSSQRSIPRYGSTPSK